MGKRANLLVVGSSSFDEFAYSEASKITNDDASKNIHDTKLKTIKTMKDMIYIYK